jgi:hypothetical protein
MTNFKEFHTSVKTVFGNGTVFIGDEVQTALVCGFTEKYRGGVVSQEILETELLEIFD